jgi:hypothetical protein
VNVLTTSLPRHVHSEACAREDWGPYGKVITCAQTYETNSRKGNFQKGVHA